mmetsp:Transcript_57326/g.123268  ORF Transcript_57326/g.123268 Transcript_57326/m.123268 type:complete len:229 (-) Transcript_57326:820-1506(-)
MHCGGSMRLLLAKPSSASQAARAPLKEFFACGKFNSRASPQSKTQSGSNIPLPTTSVLELKSTSPVSADRSRTKAVMPPATCLATTRSRSEVNSSTTSELRSPAAHSAKPLAKVARSRSPLESSPTGRMAVWRSKATADNAACASAKVEKCARAGASSFHSAVRGCPKLSIARVVFPLPEGPISAPMANFGRPSNLGTACTQSPSKPPSSNRATSPKAGERYPPPDPT